MKVFVGMETSGMLRRAFQERGHWVYSCDLLPAEDEPAIYADGTCSHIQGDIFEMLTELSDRGWWPDLAVFHPTCTFLTISAAWAFNEPDFDRYPGVGYHQKIKPGTLTGQARRDARDAQVKQVKRIWSLPIKRKAVENPIGALSSQWRKPDQIFQPNWFGDDASKSTCLWLFGLLPLWPTNVIPGRLVEWPRGSGKLVQRWANQTDSGQNNLTPGEDRWKERSRTYPGPAAAMAEQWSDIIVPEIALGAAA